MDREHGGAAHIHVECTNVDGAIAIVDRIDVCVKETEFGGLSSAGTPALSQLVGLQDSTRKSSKLPIEAISRNYQAL